MSTPEAGEETFAEYVERLLTTHDDSNASASRKTGVHASLISKWRLGETLPSIQRARQFADGMGVPRLVVMIKAGLLEPEDAQIDQLYLDLAELDREALAIDPDEQKTLRAHVKLLLNGTREQLRAVVASRPKRRRRTG